MSLPPGEWVPLAADASTRRYWRGSSEGRPVLLADFGGDEDGLRRFVHVRSLLAGHGLAVPGILGEPAGGAFLLQEFVEGWPLSKVRWSASLTSTLLDQAKRIASITDWGEGPELLELDEARLRFELSFFRLHCIEGFLNLSAPPELASALDALAEQVGAFTAALAHRDLHSENGIRERGAGRLVLVDFQDALMAPRAYDAASLAVDCYRDQAPAIREAFMAGWVERAGGTAEEFRATALQRALKALGTFGYQVTRRKRARYVKFLKPQARHALALLDAAPRPLECLEPALQSLARLG